MTDKELEKVYWLLRSVNDHLVKAEHFTADLELSIAHQQLNEEVLTALEEAFGWDEPPGSVGKTEKNLRRLLGDKVRQEK